MHSLLGAGSGLSTAAGFTYSGERFRRYFADFEDRYHFHDMYTGGFYPFESLEEYWAYWSRFIHCNRYLDVPHPEIFQNLKKLTENKDYFIITTNGIISFRNMVLTRSAFSIHRVTMVYGNA